MKFFTYTLAIASLAGLSSTAAIDLSVVDKRSVATDEYALVSGVYNQVLDYDAHISGSNSYIVIVHSRLIRPAQTRQSRALTSLLFF